MNTKHNPQQSNIEQARELLSPYLDGEVSGEEKQFVEQQLHLSAELRADLESMRQTIFLLSALPKVAATRPFTLSEADVGGPIASSKSNAGFFSLSGWLTGWVALAASLVFVAVIGGALIFGPRGSQTASEVALAPERDSTTNEPLIMEAAEKISSTQATEPASTEPLPPLENQAELADQMPVDEMADGVPTMAMTEDDAPAEEEEGGVMAAEVVEETEAPTEEQVGVTAAESIEEYALPKEPVSEEADLAAAGLAEKESTQTTTADEEAAESSLPPPSMARQATESEAATRQPAPTETPQPAPTVAPPTPLPTIQQPVVESTIEPAFPVEWLVVALLVLVGGLGLGVWLKIRRPS